MFVALDIQHEMRMRPTVIRRLYDSTLFFYIVVFYTPLPAYEDAAECSETSEYKLKTPGNYPEESI